MRISDWSSDVCSSDLRCLKPLHLLRPVEGAWHIIMSEIADILACPYPHRAALASSVDDRLGCLDPECPCSVENDGFLRYRGVPVLIAFSGDTLCERERR